jgi:hypothetical protein
MNPDRLDELIQKYVLGNQTQAETEELSRHLKQEDAVAARRKLRLALKADAHLQEAAAELGDQIGSQANTPRVVSLKSVLWTAGAIAAALAVGMFVIFQNPGNAGPQKELGVATILRIEGKALANGEHAVSDGDALQAGDRLTMAEGLVELVFRDSGVHGIATAPLSFTTESSRRIFLHRGDVKLHVPPQGIGFVVETTQREITDLGTEFVVTAREAESRVLVLDGQVAVGKKNGAPKKIMMEGEAATFDRMGKIRRLGRIPHGMPELSPSALETAGLSLPGIIYTLKDVDLPTEPHKQDHMGNRFASLILSGFRDRDSLAGLQSGKHLNFTGIAGAYNHFAERNGIGPDSVSRAGWISWYGGRLTPPRPGRYRFWGYADNNLFVAINGKPVFDGSRYDSAIRTHVTVPRQNHPAWPCLNSKAGFAAGPWIEMGDDPVQFDLLFGERFGTLTYGLLLVEREGDNYESTFWGQPKWPLFLTSAPGNIRQQELNQLRTHMEQKLMGSFSVSSNAFWKVEQSL